LTIVIYVRNIFGLATKEASHPSMMETSRATTSAVPPTADIVGHRGHVRKVPIGDMRSDLHTIFRTGEPAGNFWTAIPVQNS
jgi:hypothetical protein